ncbi:MAG: globin domain-containing protein [bacterium]
MADLDADALKSNFAAVAAHGGDNVALFFYSYLFVRNPDTRTMFPPGMMRQRDRLVGALGQIVSNVDKVDELVPFLQDLGRDHRKFGAIAGHYPAVGTALIATLKFFSADAWTPKLQEDWAAAYGIVSDTMQAAAEEDAQSRPPYWEGEIVAVERRTIDIAVVRIRTDEPVPYEAGQSLSLEVSDLRPREWRWYSPGTGPGGTEFEVHVRLINGGPVSTILVTRAKVGTKVRLGPPVGRLTLDRDSDRPLLLIAGSTGLAPMKALIDQVAADGGRRPTHLYFGARTAREVYDRDALEALDRRHDWLTVVSAVSDDEWDGRVGLIGEVAVSDGDWTEHDVYVCGSPAMVEATIKILVSSGVLEERVRFDEFGQS